MLGFYLFFQIRSSLRPANFLQAAQAARNMSASAAKRRRIDKSRKSRSVTFRKQCPGSPQGIAHTGTFSKEFRMVRLHHLKAALAATCCLLVLGCSPLIRGFTQDGFVSNGYPSVSISCTLPLITSGQSSPLIMTDVGYRSPQAWVAVYGSARDPSAPMAIIAYGETPKGFQWDPAGSSYPDMPVTSQALFGEREFSGTVRIVSAQKDPFSPLFYPLETIKEKGKEILWLAQRYCLESLNFWETKIVLEYREPLPKWVTPGVDPSLMMGTPEMAAFLQRAQEAFTLAFEEPQARSAKAPYLHGLQGRYLGAFLGSMSPRDVLLRDND